MHPDLIGPIRELLVRSGKPYVIENVEGAPLINPILLCGTMFNLRTLAGTLFGLFGEEEAYSQLRRHRLFECSFPIEVTMKCRHNDGSAIGVYGGGQHPLRKRPATVAVYGNAGGSSKRDGLLHFGVEARKEAMGIDWMTGSELSQAIPPAYTEFIGKHFIQASVEAWSK